VNFSYTNPTPKTKPSDAKKFKSRRYCICCGRKSSHLIKEDEFYVCGKRCRERFETNKTLHDSVDLARCKVVYGHE